MGGGGGNGGGDEDEDADAAPDDVTREVVCCKVFHNREEEGKDCRRCLAAPPDGFRIKMPGLGGRFRSAFNKPGLKFK